MEELEQISQGLKAEKQRQTRPKKVAAKVKTSNVFKKSVSPKKNKKENLTTETKAPTTPKRNTRSSVEKFEGFSAPLAEHSSEQQ